MLLLNFANIAFCYKMLKYNYFFSITNLKNLQILYVVYMYKIFLLIGIIVLQYIFSISFMIIITV